MTNGRKKSHQRIKKTSETGVKLTEVKTHDRKSHYYLLKQYSQRCIKMSHTVRSKSSLQFDFKIIKKFNETDYKKHRRTSPELKSDGKAKLRTYSSR